MSAYRSGFVSIIGCPNVGKSTLLNRMVGQKIAIVSSRAQTTRNQIMGVVSRPGYQIVFLDTPGVTHPKNRLGEYMQKVAYDALSEVEAVLFVADATQGVRQRDEQIIERLKKSRAPVIALINKSDAASMTQMQTAREKLEKAGCFQKILSASAAEGDGMDALEETLSAYLVEGPQYFPDDMVTDQQIGRATCRERV